MLRAGDAVDWDGRAWTVLNVGLSAITLLAEDRSIAQIPSDKFDECVRKKSIRVLSGSAKEDERRRAGLFHDLRGTLMRLDSVAAAAPT
jgi:hypothetical protein